MRIFKSFASLAIVLSCAFFAEAQSKARVEAIVKTTADAAKKCADLKPGKIVSLPQAEYPLEAKAARIGGTIAVNVKLDEKGAFAEALNVAGNTVLQGAAIQAARRVKFSATVCDGARTAATVVLFYNFIPSEIAGAYFKPAKIEDLTDVKNDSEFYEPVLNLTENYNLAHGYADKKFYADAPLTRGDFAEFLRRTLDLLAERSKISGKLPREIGLFFPLNPQKLKTFDQIKNFDEKDAAAESVKVLLLTYDIALTNDKREFRGEDYLTRAAVVDLWTSIFGAEAIPVNSVLTKTADDDRVMTRGEFALFLQESLSVLTYKTLP